MKAKTGTQTTAASPAAPFDVLLKASQGWAPSATQFIAGWQRQLNAGLRIVDAALASAVSVRDARLPATSEFLARAAELQKSMLEVRSPLDLWTVQCNWMMENATHTLALWKVAFDAATAANANFCDCLRDESQQPGNSARVSGKAAVDAPGGSLATQDLVKTALVTFDAAYGQMLRNSQQMMAAATEALSAGMRRGAPEASKPGAK